MPDRIQTSSFSQWLWRWLIAPSPKITEPDQRRQASLLTGLLLGMIAVAIAMKAVTNFLIDWAGYDSQYQVIVTVLLLIVVYGISRTQHLQLAATLMVVVSSFAIFMTGWTEPKGVLSGLFDFLIVPLWLGSLFIRLKKLMMFIVGALIGLLLFPFVSSGVSHGQILAGPFAFVSISSLLLLTVTWHRNRLEQDRQMELLAKELRTQRVAARGDALLRAAKRLNAHLDENMVLRAIGEEISNALNVPISIIMLYDSAAKDLYAAGGAGLTTDLIDKMPHLSKEVFERTIKAFGKVFSLQDLQSVMPDSSFLAYFQQVDLRSLAFATMEYEHELIGTLSAITVGNIHEFSNDEILLIQGLADQAALALVNTRLYNDAQRRLEQLQAMRAIDAAIASNRNLEENLIVLLEKITEQLKVDSAVFLLLDEANQYLEFATSLGFHAPKLPFTRMRLGEGMAGRAALERKVVYTQDLRIDPQTLLNASLLEQEGFISFYAAPLIAQGKVKGVLEIFHRSMLSPDDEWLSFFEVLAGQAAIAIESTTLFQDLQRANDELSQAYDSTIEGWSRALDLRDKETEGHTQRVTRMTLKLARAIGFTEPELIQIRRGALLHDIGKLGIPDGILLKPGALTDDEWILMRQHPQFAHEMLAPIDYLKSALEIPYCHHEKWDGTGYPRGLKGEAIPLSARIFALADVYDALTSDRPYRQAWTKEKTLEYIRALSGTHFDPQSVELLMKAMDDE